MVSPKQFVESKVAEGAVVVFSKTYCPFCVRVKKLFDSMGIPFIAVELNELENGSEVQSALAELTHQRTVPNVFIKGQHLGGCDDTFAAQSSGKLTKLLA